jgi:biotin transport system substrate-specific component
MKQISVKNIAMLGIMTALICVLAPVAIPLPLTPIPFTLSVFIVTLAGAILKPAYAFAAPLFYIVLGLIGLPVFAGWTGGAGIAFEPSFGYVIAYPFMALIVSLALNVNGSAFSYAIGALTAQIFCYALGTVWFMSMAHLPFLQSLGLCVLPFIPMDIAKLILAGAAYFAVRRRIPIRGGN